MFFPQGFMTGCLQTHARQYKIAIDELAFSFEILEAEDPEQVEERPQDGVFIYGLYMDGARYNREQRCIDDQNPVSIKICFCIANYLTLTHITIGRTVRHDASDPLQADEGLRCQPRRVLVPHVQDRPAPWCAVYDRSVDELRHLGRDPRQPGSLRPTSALDPQSSSSPLPAQRVMNGGVRRSH